MFHFDVSECACISIYHGRGMQVNLDINDLWLYGHNLLFSSHALFLFNKRFKCKTYKYFINGYHLLKDKACV